MSDRPPAVLAYERPSTACGVRVEAAPGGAWLSHPLNTPRELTPPLIGSAFAAVVLLVVLVGLAGELSARSGAYDFGTGLGVAALCALAAVRVYRLARNVRRYARGQGRVRRVFLSRDKVAFDLADDGTADQRIGAVRSVDPWPGPRRPIVGGRRWELRIHAGLAGPTGHVRALLVGRSEAEVRRAVVELTAALWPPDIPVGATPADPVTPIRLAPKSSSHPRASPARPV